MKSNQYSASVIALIAMITVVPLVALSWLGWRLLDQDRLLEHQYLQDRVERAADLIVAEIGKAVSTTEQQLLSGNADWPDGAVTVVYEDGNFRIYPRARAAFVPEPEALPEASASVFLEGERLEFQHNDPVAAAGQFREAANSTDPAVRAGALHRLGRNLYKAGRGEDALSVYAELALIDGVLVDGVPAGLVGGFARLRILDAMGRTEELEAEAGRMSHNLRHGRWSLTEPVYRLYLNDVNRWHQLDDDTRTQAEILGEALKAVWSRRDVAGTSMRESIGVHGESVLLLWKIADDATRVMIATADHVKTHWLGPTFELARNQEVGLALQDRDSRSLFGESVSDNLPGTVRLTQATSLPWTVSVTSLVPAGDDASFARRRQWLIAGFVLVASMALTASYLIFRGVNRERELVRMQSEFVGAVSHEFRTPLTALRQFTDMLRGNRKLDDNRREVCYEALASATDRLQHLVESLLEFGRMDAGARTYELQPLDCTKLVRDSVDVFRTEGLAAGHDIRLDAESAPMILGDCDALTRALHNLLDNAMKYSPGQHDVEVAVKRDGNEVTIEVADHGIGIPAGELDAIFTKFQRGEHARAQGIRGTGIGLAMVDDIIRAHGGRITVDSTPGHGSTFAIVLPVIDEEV